MLEVDRKGAVALSHSCNISRKNVMTVWEKISSENSRRTSIDFEVDLRNRWKCENFSIIFLGQCLRNVSIYCGFDEYFMKDDDSQGEGVGCSENWFMN